MTDQTDSILIEALETLIDSEWPDQPVADVRRLAEDCAGLEDEPLPYVDAVDMYDEWIRRIGGVRNLPAYLATLRAGDRRARKPQTFATWADLLDAVGAGYPLYYQAPMDYRAAQVSAVLRKDGKLRVTPTYTDADPFTADQGHLGRFRRSR